MDRRTFVRLVAATPLAAKLQTPTGLPALKVVSHYKPAPVPGMPGPYPGRVVAVKSDRSVDPISGAANADVVREMMAQGMRALTGATATSDAWPF